MQLKVNDFVKVEITDLGSSGEGVGKVDGFTIFVQGALPQEFVQAKVILSKSSYAVAQLVEILKLSPQRVKPCCSIFDTCGGCQLQHLSYQAQLVMKNKKVSDALKRIGHIENVAVRETLGMSEPWYYRNKMLFAVGENNEGVALGCYAKASHEVIDASVCLIQKNENNIILQVVREWLVKYRLSFYNEQTAKGLIRNLLGRVGPQSGQILVGLVTSEKSVPFLPKLIQMLKERVTGLTGIVQIVRSGKGNIVLAGEQYLLWGDSRIRGDIGDLSFNISAKSFFQVNSEQTQVLYKEALAMAGLQGGETVIEAYSGTGTIGLLFAKQAAKVYGLELSKEAVADAKENALLNGCKNIEFIQGDVAYTLPNLLKTGIKADIIVVDPPRAGLALKVVQTIAAAKPEKIIYISCNPASFARDAAILAETYQLTGVQPVDMFPMTAHIESVAKFIKRK